MQLQAPATDSPSHARLSHIRRGIADADQRYIYFSALAVPGHLMMAAAKAVILVMAFSAFMAANVLFTLGLAVIKIVVIRAARNVPSASGGALPPAYRVTGVLIVVFSAAYAVSCFPLALGSSSSGSYSRIQAIAIATITFTELAMAVHGLLSSRRRKNPLMEAIKLSNLAASLVLLVLTQTALLSFAGQGGDLSRCNGWFGVVMGLLAASVGAYMVVRHFRHSVGRACVGAGRRGHDSPRTLDGKGFRQPAGR